MGPRKEKPAWIEPNMATDEEAEARSDQPQTPVKWPKKPAAPEPAQLGIEEFMMPRMMTLRLAKGVLPPQTLIHRDAATALQYATSVFLNHVAAAANEHTLAAQRKNISPHDMLLGLKDTEWGSLVPQLEEELAIYVRQINDKRNEYRRKLKERGSGVGAADTSLGPDDTAAASDDMEEDGMTAKATTIASGGNKETRKGGDGDGAEPKAKRARLSDNAKADDEMDEDIADDEEQDEEEDEEEEEEDEDEGEEEGDEEEGEEDVDDRTSEREDADEDEEEEDNDDEQDSD